MEKLNPGLERSFFYNMGHANRPDLKNKENTMIITKMKADRIQAMKDGDKTAKNLLSTLIGMLENKAKTTGTGITDIMAVQACKKIQNANKLTIDSNALINNRVFLELENEILEKYIPYQLPEEKIREIITTFDDTNIGVVMKYFKENYDGQVDNKLVSQIAQETITK
jgi:uncharacterized protein YqeY